MADKSDPPELTKLPSEAEYHAQRAKNARSGDIEATKEILKDFAFGVDHYNERTWSVPKIPWPYVRYVADAVRKAEAAEPNRAGAALGLKSHKTGRPKGSNEYDPVALAAAYLLLIRAGNAPKTAKSLLREYVGASEDVVASAVTTYVRLQDRKQFDYELLKAMANGYRDELSKLDRDEFERLKLSGKISPIFSD